MFFHNFQYKYIIHIGVELRKIRYFKNYISYSHCAIKCEYTFPRFAKQQWLIIFYFLVFYICLLWIYAEVKITMELMTPHKLNNKHFNHINPIISHSCPACQHVQKKLIQIYITISLSV